MVWEWQVDRLGLFKFEEHITKKEARAAAWALAIDLSDPALHHFRLVRLVDNFSVVLALNKGRAASFGLLMPKNSRVVYSV